MALGSTPNESPISERRANHLPQPQSSAAASISCRRATIISRNHLPRSYANAPIIRRAPTICRNYLLNAPIIYRRFMQLSAASIICRRAKVISCHRANHLPRSSANASQCPSNLPRSSAQCPNHLHSSADALRTFIGIAPIICRPLLCSAISPCHRSTV